MNFDAKKLLLLMGKPHADSLPDFKKSMLAALLKPVMPVDRHQSMSFFLFGTDPFLIVAPYLSMISPHIGSNLLGLGAELEHQINLFVCFNVMQFIMNTNIFHSLCSDFIIYLLATEIFNTG